MEKKKDSWDKLAESRIKKKNKGAKYIKGDDFSEKN